jgi:RNA polymerase sigma-70 factor (ECF subfamily)
VTEDNAFQDLIGRVRAGDQAAAAELVRRYEPAIRRAVRVRLHDDRLRRLLDSTDICQSVFGSFYVRLAMGQYELEKPQQLLKLLTDMSRKKLVDQQRRQRAARRDYRRLIPGEFDEARVADTGDSPSQQVAAREMLQEVRKRLSPDELYLSEQRAQGRDWAQIAAEQGGSPEALRKKLVRAVGRVTQELGLDD